MTTLTSFHGDGSYGTTPSPFPQSPRLLLLHPTASRFARAAGSYLCCFTHVPSWLLFSLQEICSSSLLLSSMEIMSIPLLACPFHLCIPPSHSAEILHLILGQLKGFWKGSVEICWDGQG